MNYTTHKLTHEQKENLFNKHKDLIYMVFCCGGFMLRKQMRKLFHLISGRAEKDIEFDIAELICNGFILQKTINSDTKATMLYLSKYPQSLFLNRSSGDVAAINWTTQKIFEQIFKIDYIIEKILPDMGQQDFEISTDNIIAYLNWKGSNLLLSNNQMDMLDFYNNLWSVFITNNVQPNNVQPTDDFFRDLEIARYEKEAFECRNKGNSEPAPCRAKTQRDMEMDSYSSDIEKNKYFYSLKNFASHGFYIEGMESDTVKICFFDSMDSIQTKKLYTQLSFILLMFQRYINNYNIQISCTVYLWDCERAAHLKSEECKHAYDFYHQEWTTLSKKHKTMHDIGILPSNFENISVDYKSMEIFAKYCIHQ